MKVIALKNFQITNPKKQTNTNDQIQNLKQKNNRFEPVWNLEFVIYL